MSMLTTFLPYLPIAIFGLLIGSFLSVCIYRIPLGRKSALEEDGDEIEQVEKNSEYFEKKVTIIYPPRSFCPSCGNQLKWYHNIPVFSWIALGGKCAFCKTRISARYPFLEFLSAFFAVFSVYCFGFSVTALLAYAFCCMLIVITFTDIDYYIIPNVVSYPAILLGFVFAGIQEFFPIAGLPFVQGAGESVFGLLAGAGFLWLISELYFRIRKKEGLGFGDVKLLAITGLWFGPLGAWYTIFIGSLLGSVLGILLLLCCGRKFSQYLPFGPYLAFANILYLFWGYKQMLPGSLGLM